MAMSIHWLRNSDWSSARSCRWDFAIGSEEWGTEEDQQGMQAQVLGQDMAWLINKLNIEVRMDARGAVPRADVAGLSQRLPNLPGRPQGSPYAASLPDVVEKGAGVWAQPSLRRSSLFPSPQEVVQDHPDYRQPDDQDDPEDLHSCLHGPPDNVHDRKDLQNQNSKTQ
jgi:hypothetical protein